MALVHSKSSPVARNSLASRTELDDAIREFQKVLSKDQRDDLLQISTIPGADEVMVFTAKLDGSCRSQRGRSIASRLHTVLQAVREFSTIVDTFVSSHPKIAALVWGSVKLTMTIAVNILSYFEPISHLFMELSDHCPRFAQYQALYPSCSRLQTALCGFNASIVRTCKHIVEVINRSWQTQLLHVLWQSVEQEFKPHTDDMKRWSRVVQHEIDLALAQASDFDRRLQDQERRDASRFRNKVTGFITSTSASFSDFKKMQLDSDQRRSRQEKQDLINNVSLYNTLDESREACKARHCHTAKWVLETSEFKQWTQEVSSSTLLWCPGKIGSGKTVLAASAIQHILATKRSSDTCVTFFFITYSDTTPQTADEIIRSIIAQSLDPTSLSEEMQDALYSLKQNPCPSLDDLRSILELRMDTSDAFYIFIDGLDECEAQERYLLISTLQKLHRATPKLKSYVAGRQSLTSELEIFFPGVATVSMESAGLKADLNIYVRETLRDRVESKSLLIDDDALFEEIEKKLASHADGMFLWVKYLIAELCLHRRDRDIRKALYNLPRSLAETFDRLLRRIESMSTASDARSIFEWVSAAQRPLKLEELREALAVEILELRVENGNRVNGIENITSWTGDLLKVDEELKTVHFAHASIHDFIVKNRSRIESFHFDLEGLNHHIGEICITYLHLEVLQNTLSLRRRPHTLPSPIRIAKAALQVHMSNGVSTLGARLLSSKKTPLTPKLQLDFTDPLASSEKAIQTSFDQNIQATCPFLDYAKTFWLSHTTRFERTRSKTWTLWRQIILNGHGLAYLPWGGPEADQSDILDYAVMARHYALLRLCATEADPLEADLDYSVRKCASHGDADTMQVLLQGEISKETIIQALYTSCTEGYRHMTDLLMTVLEAAAGPVFANSPESQIALLLGCRNGRDNIVQRLLEYKVDPDAPLLKEAPLVVSCAGGHLQIAELLVRAGADMNVRQQVQSTANNTPLEAASAAGHLPVVEWLVNQSRGQMNFSKVLIPPLKAAAAAGHLDIVKWLIQQTTRSDSFPLVVAAQKAARQAEQFQVDTWLTRMNDRR